MLCLPRCSGAQVGTGDIPLVLGAADASGWRAGVGANAIYFQDAPNNFWGARPTVRDSFVAWPPKGFVPYTVLTGAGSAAGRALAGWLDVRPA